MKKFVMGKYHAYAWKGTNKWGKKAKGVIIADNNIGAEEEAQKLGLKVTFLKRRPYWMLPGEANKRIKVIDIVLVMRQLSTLISAGIPLVQGLEIMSAGTEKVKLRSLILTIRDNVASGQAFSEALTPYPYFFSPLICGLISAGEQSGTLDRMVSEVALFLERQEHLKNLIKKAMYYPITMLSISLLVCAAILVFLVPRFEKIYASFGAKLPTFTLKVVGLSQIVREDWLWILIILTVLIFGYRKLKEKSEKFQRILDTISLHIVIFGTLTRKAIISRVCSTLAITLGAGIPLIDALNRVADVANNQLFRDAILQTREQVSQGESIASSMRSTQMFPPMVSQMTEIGEKSGSLDQMLDKIGQYYRDQVNTAVEGLSTMIEPLLIVILGAIIGVFVFAMYLPIFNLGMAIK